MALRIQLERQNRMQLPSIAEYSRVWGLNKDRAKLLKKGAIILHPGPVNRGVEIDPEVADGPNSRDPRSGRQRRARPHGGARRGLQSGRTRRRGSQGGISV